MAQNQPKTVATDADVDAFLAGLDEGKRADARRLVEIMSHITGEPPRLWGSIVGFGSYHYKYPSGHEGDSSRIGFSPRKDEFSLYLTCHPEEVGARDALLAELGRHRMGKGCLYVRRLADVDIEVLKQVLTMSLASLERFYPERDPG